jgi:hypothetical protein
MCTDVQAWHLRIARATHSPFALGAFSRLQPRGTLSLLFDEKSQHSLASAG